MLSAKKSLRRSSRDGSQRCTSCTSMSCSLSLSSLANIVRIASLWRTMEKTRACSHLSLRIATILKMGEAHATVVILRVARLPAPRARGSEDVLTLLYLTTMRSSANTPMPLMDLRLEMGIKMTIGFTITTITIQSMQL